MVVITITITAAHSLPASFLNEEFCRYTDMASLSAEGPLKHWARAYDFRFVREQGMVVPQVVLVLLLICIGEVCELWRTIDLNSCE